MTNSTYIYILQDPRTGGVRYIGKSNNPSKRLSAHIQDNESTHKTRWIKSLKLNGLLPNLEIIDEIPEQEWQFWEMHYISLYKSWGFNLVNGDNGGLGTGRLSEEVKNKIGKSIKGKKYFARKVNTIYLPAMRERALGKNPSKETREKMSLGKKGKYTKEKNWFWGKTQSSEMIEKRTMQLRIPVIQINNKGEYIKYWSSAKQIENELNISGDTVSRDCKGLTGGKIRNRKIARPRFRYASTEEIVDNTKTKN